MEMSLSLFPVSTAETPLGLVGPARPAAIAVVDSHDASRALLAGRASRAGIRVREYASPLALAARLDDDLDCILLVDRGPDELTSDFVNLVERHASPTPVVSVAVNPSPACIVRLMHAGAHSAVSASASTSELSAAIDDAIADGRARRAALQRKAACRRRIDALLPGELDVFRHVVDGEPNKVIARKLNVSIRTIENWRRQVYDKIGVDSVAQLVAFAYHAEDSRLTLWTPPVGDDL